MGYLLPIVFTAIGSSALYYLMKSIFSRTDQLVKIPEKLDSNDKSTTNIKPFNISFSSKLVEDLQTRLRNVRKDDNYDTNNVMQKFLNYWANSYNFKNRENYINKYPHFITTIQGLDIHYVHVKPKLQQKKKILPILMLHGWPSSIIEFYKIIPLLTEARQNYSFVFEVIVPSPPGFGFSSASSGLSCIHISAILKNLMLRLGHDKFYIQDGDYGIFISRFMTCLFPENVLGTYSNVRALLNKKRKAPSPTDIEKIHKQMTLSNKLLTTMKYLHIHATPETIGVGLNDSPAALAAYIIEKLSIGTIYFKKLDEFLHKYSYDDLIDNLMIYWTSKCITTALRIYGEQFNDLQSACFKLLIDHSTKVNVPYHFSTTLKKIPKSSVRNEQLQQETPDENLNSRFPAIEEPELLAKNIWQKIKRWDKRNDKYKKNS